MKLRLYKDSVRLRLSKDDVVELISRGWVRSETNLTPDTKLVYTVRASESATAIGTSFQHGTICIDVPWKVVREWGGGNEVSLHASQPVGEQRTLSILIEKDFECLNPQGNEPGEHLYPNPRMARHEQVIPEE